MPIYEYRCENGHISEQFRRMSDPPLAACACGAPVQKMLSPVSIHFKGSGFYNTDYRRKGAGKTDGESGPSTGDAKTGTSDKASTDSAASNTAGSTSKSNGSGSAPSDSSGPAKSE